MAVLAIPQSDSYVLEWQAHRFDASEGLAPVKRLMSKSPWAIRLLIDDDGAHVVSVIVHPSGEIESWKTDHGDWIVRSPHGKFWFMSHEEFTSQFVWRA